MRRAADNRSDYIRLIIHYKHKRADVKAKYKRGDPAYKVATKRINEKIATYKNQVKRIDRYNASLSSINSLVKEYYNVSMYKMNTNWKNTWRKPLIWKMFCKYAIEHRIPDRHVSNYIGWKKKRAGFYRLQFTRAMQHDDILKQQWHKFKKFMDRVPQQKTA